MIIVMSLPDPPIHSIVQRGDASGGSILNQAGRDIEVKLPSPEISWNDRKAMWAADPTSIAAPRDALDHPVRGRDTLLAVLHRAVEEADGQVHVLTGMGGCGKTTVALAVIQQVADRMPTWWISAADGATFTDRLCRVATCLGASIDQATRASADASAAMDLFVASCVTYNSPFLLVLDNADDLRILRQKGDRPDDGLGWIRAVAHGTIIVTSRDTRSAICGSHHHHLLPLSTNDGAQILLDIAGPRAGDHQEARNLAQRLGQLPLALYLAGTYLAYTLRDLQAAPWRTTIQRFADYQAAYKARPAVLDDVPPDAFSDDRDPRRVITRTWELSLDLLERQRVPAARPLLRLLACYAAAPLPFVTLLESDVLTSSPLMAGCTAENLPYLILALTRLGLIDQQSPPEGDTHRARWTVTLHPLVRDITITSPDIAGNPTGFPALAIRLLTEALDSADVGQPDDPTRWPWWQALAAHAAHLHHTVAGCDQFPPEIAEAACRAANDAARYLEAAGRYQSAEAEYRSVLDTQSRLLGDDHTDALATRHGLAWILFRRGRPDDAKAEFEMTLAARQRLLGEDHPDSLTTRTGLARVLCDQRHFDDAKAELQAVLAAQRQLLGDDHPDTLRSANNLAFDLRNLGDHEGARHLNEDILERRRRVLGDDHPDTLASANNLADSLQDLKRYKEARQMREDVLRRMRRTLGEDHLDTLSAAAQLAHDLFQLGDYFGALQIDEHVLERRRRLLGEDHPDTLQSVNNVRACRTRLR